MAPVTPVAAVSVAPEPPEAADISRSRSRRDVEEDPSWLRLSERDGAYSGSGVSESVGAGAAIPVGAGAGQRVSCLNLGSGTSVRLRQLWPLTQLPRPGPGIIIISGNEQMGVRIYSTRREICKTKDAIKIHVPMEDSHNNNNPLAV